MNFKSNFSAVLVMVGVGVACLVSPRTAEGQAAKLYPTYLNGGTNVIAGPGTNTIATTGGTNCIIAVGEYHRAGLTLSAKPLSSSTGTIVHRISGSMDNGSTFESVPKLAITNTYAGTGAVIQCLQIDCGSYTHLAIVSQESTNAIISTNIVATWSLTSPKFGAVPATR